MLPDTSYDLTETHFALPPQATFSSSEPVGPCCPLTRESIGQLNPHLSPEEVELKYVEFHHGKQRAQQLRKTLMSRRAIGPEPCCHVDHYYG